MFGVDPEAVVSRTFGKVWSRADTFDPEKRGKGTARENAGKNWIFQILEYEIISDIRARAKRAEVSLVDGFGEARTESGEGTDETAFDAIGDEQIYALEAV